MKRTGRPKKVPDYVRVRRALLRFREMTIAEQRLFLIEAIEYSPAAVPELGVQFFSRRAVEEQAERLWNSPVATPTADAIKGRVAP